MAGLIGPVGSFWVPESSPWVEVHAPEVVRNRLSYFILDTNYQSPLLRREKFEHFIGPKPGS